MPPAISDDEQSDIDDTGAPLDELMSPGSASEIEVDATNGDASANLDGADNEDDEGDDEDDEMFAVEAIKKHMIDESGALRFQVKWEGYDSKKDLTWEPEENLAESAEEILAQYYKKLGGREKILEDSGKAAKGKKRGRAATATSAAPAKRSKKNGSHPSESTPPASKKWSPPAGSWEDEVDFIDTCEEENGKLMVYLNWKNNNKTKHSTEVIYMKCPQKMLRFYEQHVRIVGKDVQETPVKLGSEA